MERITINPNQCGGRPCIRGMRIRVKDVFDTADMPTEYGSPIFAGHRPRADASAVALLRAAGAVCLGKTVTAEEICRECPEREVRGESWCHSPSSCHRRYVRREVR